MSAADTQIALLAQRGAAALIAQLDSQTQEQLDGEQALVVTQSVQAGQGVSISLEMRLTFTDNSSEMGQSSGTGK